MLCGEKLWDSRAVLSLIRLSLTSSSLRWWFLPTSVIILVVVTKIFKGNFSMSGFKGIISRLSAALYILLKLFSEHVALPPRPPGDTSCRIPQTKRRMPLELYHGPQLVPFHRCLFLLLPKKDPPLTHLSFTVMWCIPPGKKSQDPEQRSDLKPSS